MHSKFAFYRMPHYFWFVNIFGVLPIFCDFSMFQRLTVGFLATKGF
jgi:hypothetical protein